MNSKLTRACLPPDRGEIFRLLDMFEDGTYTENYMVASVMKHLRGRAIPVLVRNVVAEYFKGNTRKIRVV